MPTNRHGKDTKVLFGAYDLSSFSTEVSVSNKFETGEITTLGSSAKSYISGLQDGTIAIKGLFDGSATATDYLIDTYITADATPAVTIAPDGGLVNPSSGAGRRCYLAQVKTTSKEIGAPVSDVVSLNLDLQCSGGARGGYILEANRADTASTNGTNYLDNGAGAATTTIGATANLHVTANTRSTTSVIKVQHSTDNSTWVDLITFSTVAIATLTNEQVSVTTNPVNRYIRAISTLTAGTGTITFTISFARSKN